MGHETWLLGHRRTATTTRTAGFQRRRRAWVLLGPGRRLAARATAPARRGAAAKSTCHVTRSLGRPRGRRGAAGREPTAGCLRNTRAAAARSGVRCRAADAAVISPTGRRLAARAMRARMLFTPRVPPPDRSSRPRGLHSRGSADPGCAQLLLHSGAKRRRSGRRRAGAWHRSAQRHAPRCSRWGRGRRDVARAAQAARRRHRPFNWPARRGERQRASRTHCAPPPPAGTPYRLRARVSRQIVSPSVQRCRAA